MSTPILETLTDKLILAITKDVNSLVKVPDFILKSAADAFGEIYSAQIFNLVSQETNYQLFAIPNNLIGTNNEFDIVNGNKTPLEIADNLKVTIQTSLSINIAQKITEDLISNFNLNLVENGDKENILETLTDSYKELAVIMVNELVYDSLIDYVKSIFNRKQTVPTAIPNVDTIYNTSYYGTGITFSDLVSDVAGIANGALRAIDNLYIDTFASKYLTSSYNFTISNPENEEKLIVLDQGFLDPNATYPTKDYAGLGDINKLATGNVFGTVVKEKEYNRITGVQSASGVPWDEPQSAYAAVYPFNKVTQTESGHVIEIDDTPGSERLHVYHKAGTSIEIDSFGTIVKKTKGSSYEIIDKNGYISIYGKADVSVNGECSIFVGNKATIQVDGDTNLTCFNDVTVEAAGKMNLSAAEEINIKSKKVNIESTGALNLRAESRLSISTADEMHLKSSLSTLIESKYNMWINVASTYALDSALAAVNTGIAMLPIFKPSDAGKAENGMLDKRKTLFNRDIEDTNPPNIVSRSVIEAEHGGEGQTANETANVLISGVTTKAELGQQPTVIDTAQITSRSTKIVPATNSLKSAKELPGNYQLSPNYTLKMLTTETAVSKYQIDNKGLPYGEIVFNLQQLALNILEPIFKLFPNMYVSSGYRPNSAAERSSQHTKGQAVDIQFKNVKSGDYYMIAVALAKVLNYDQLILEYSTKAHHPWLHISFAGSSNKKQLLTMYNGSVRGSSLIKLM